MHAAWFLTRSRVGLLGLLLAALPCFLVQAPPAEALSVRAIVDRNRISEGESVELRVVMTDGEGEVDVSGVKDFDVAYRGRSSSVRIVNMQMTREVSLVYSLTPLRSGTLTIPALTVRTGGEILRTDPVTIQVGREAATSSGTAGDLLVTASVSEAHPWTGQEVSYTFRFLAGTRIYNARYKKPSFDGFSITEINGQKEYSTVVNGKQYSVTEITYLLTPLREGDLTIGPGILTCDVADTSRHEPRRGPSGSIFDDPFFSGMRTVTRTVRSQAIPITARALPPYQGTGTFSGLIGRFRLKAELETREIHVGDSVTLAVTVEGTGNVQDAPEPQFRRPAGVKLYPDNPEESVSHDAAGTRGKKIFRFALVPVEAGSLSVGPFSYTVFDPQAGEYREMRIEAVGIKVQPSAGESESMTPSSGPMPLTSIPGAKKDVVRTGEDILTVRKDLDALKRNRDLSLPLFVLLLSIPCILHLGVLAATRSKRREISAREQMTARARALLRQAEQSRMEERSEDALTFLSRALNAGILAAAGRLGESLTYEEARRLLTESGGAGDEADRVVDLLTRLDACRYGGAKGAGRIEALRQEVAGMLRLLAGGGPR